MDALDPLEVWARPASEHLRPSAPRRLFLNGHPVGVSRFLAIDTGAHFGLAWVDVIDPERNPRGWIERRYPNTPAIRVAHGGRLARWPILWGGRRTIATKKRGDKNPQAIADLLTFEALIAAIEEIGPNAIILEDPIDARPSWDGQKQGGRESGETRYRQGVHFALALLAGGRTFADPADRVTCYAVKGRRVKTLGPSERDGWLVGTTKPRALAMASQALDRLAWSGLVSPPNFEALTEHERVAFAVLIRHLMRYTFTPETP